MKVWKTRATRTSDALRADGGAAQPLSDTDGDGGRGRESMPGEEGWIGEDDRWDL